MIYYIRLLSLFLLSIVLIISSAYGQNFKFVDDRSRDSRTEIVNGKEITIHSLENCTQEVYRTKHKEDCETTEKIHSVFSKKLIGKTITLPKRQYPAPEFSVLLMEASRGNNPQVQAEVGFRYIIGNGVRRNLSKAVEWYKKAAIQEYQPAQFALGNILTSGLINKGTILDDTKYSLNHLVRFKEKKFDDFS